MTPRPVILIVCDYYLPGFESGGAMRTIVNMVERLGGDFEFKIVTRDHDGPLNQTPYAAVRIGEWNRVGKADVYYLPAADIRTFALGPLIKQVSPDAVYLNSFFSPLTITVLILRKLNRISPVRVVLAPEGEFSPGALSLKAAKKAVYLKAAKSLQLLRDISWKAASENERSDIEKVIGNRARIQTAPNMPPIRINEQYAQAAKPTKDVGSAKMVFVSRFMRKKNFNWLLKHLRGIRGELAIDIYGPIEEADYWTEAQKLIAALPPTITITARGPISHDQVAATLMKYHFFVLPTLGENFGHVFIEALAAGCPLVISDRTPWRDLEEKGVGWDLPLENPAAWTAVLNDCLAMNQFEFTEISEAARRFAEDWLSDPAIEESNRRVLREI